MCPDTQRIHGALGIIKEINRRGKHLQQSNLESLPNSSKNPTGMVQLSLRSHAEGTME